MQIQVIYKDGAFIPLVPVPFKESDTPITLEIVSPVGDTFSEDNELSSRLRTILGPAAKRRLAPSKEEDRNNLLDVLKERE